jgi:hypothetical protein
VWLAPLLVRLLAIPNLRLDPERGRGRVAQYTAKGLSSAGGVPGARNAARAAFGLAGS